MWGDKPYTFVIFPHRFGNQPHAPFTAMEIDAALRTAYFSGQWDAIHISSQVYQHDMREVSTGYYSDQSVVTPGTVNDWVPIHQARWNRLDHFTHIHTLVAFGVYLPYTDIQIVIHAIDVANARADYGVVKTFNVGDLTSPDAYIGARAIVDNAQRHNNYPTLNQLAIFVTTLDLQLDTLLLSSEFDIFVKVSSRYMSADNTLHPASFRPAWIDMQAELRY